ncbi:AAA family ATPase [Pseudoalteromonas luteoviolacea]|uniref:AAA family ATPase n=1 Tax=Pseudoalteromonas luteoviolacea TaxID=43657 RepID=UPI001151A452|nr:AAA family ATPase [Pseudoalteromonas luteoviolacea]TQF71892.1 AAA family ATPase [Pseudoalteromonas luteoviolacea]
MRLKSVFISEFKNLKKFDISFFGDSFIDIFVGKNGTGKSNFFEALICIFHHLYEYGSEDADLYFDYKVVFEIDGNETTIEFINSTFKVNGADRKTLTNVPLPENVLTYYSGHNEQVSVLVNKYQASFAKKIKSADFDETRKFIGIGNDYKELLLAVILMQLEGNKSKEFICQKLSITKVDPLIKLELVRPTYASSSTFDMDEANDPEQRYWKPQGITKDFLDRLTNCVSKAGDNETRTEGFLSDSNKYVLYFDIATIQQEFTDYSSQDLFRQFDNLRTLGMLQSINIPVEINEKQEANISFFSDGQFQSVYIYAISELFKDKNCVTLLDEPDSFLHPEWQYDFLQQVFEITGEAASSNHVLMSSHSAVTLIPHNEPKIKFFDIKDSYANCYELPKTIAVKRLSSDLIKYSEQEQLLSIINTIQIENKPVFFTEGSTDPLIIKTAWYKLYEEEIPFIPFYAFSCTYINQLITDDRIHNEMGNLPIFALFDFDQAFNQWNGLNGDQLEQDPYRGLAKKWANGESYAFMLPIPDNADIKRQVFKNHQDGETFGGNSSCEIEHLFYGQAATAQYFENEPCVGGSKIAFKSDGDKTTFAKEVVNNLEPDCFEVFRPMFEFIKQKCAEVAAQQAV